MPCRASLLSLIAGGLLCLAFPTFDVWVAAPVALALWAWAGPVPELAAASCGAGRWARLLRPDAELVGHLRRRTAWIALASLEALFIGAAGALYGC